MKKSKALLFPVFFGMLLSGCGGGGNTPAPVKKATINIEANQYMTTTLEAGEYELNKAIEFTVSPINEEYSVSSVKMDEVELPPSNSNKYTFTPTEEKTYTLKVSTSEVSNKVVYTFEGLTEENYVQKLNKKGTRIAAEPYVTSDGFDNVFKDDKFYVAADKIFKFVCRIDESVTNVWIRKIELTFEDNKNAVTAIIGDDTESYSNGVWTTTKTKGNQGTAEIVFKGTGEAVITKAVVTTAPFVQDSVAVEFNGLDSNDKVYYFEGGASFEMWEKKQPLTANTKLFTLQTYYLWVERSQDHKDYYDGLTLSYKKSMLMETKFVPTDESQLPKDEITVFTFSPLEEDADAGKSTIDCNWSPKVADKNIIIDTKSANQYVKGFMETDPLASIGLTNVLFGADAKINLHPKKGYMGLKMFVNGVEAKKEEESYDYSFKIPFAKEIKISFSATEGDEQTAGKTVVALTGENADKGILITDTNEGVLYILFRPSEDHPTAVTKSLLFKGTPLKEVKTGEEEIDERCIYSFTEDQAREFYATEDKSSLFTAVIEENPTYTSSLKINKGAFKVAIEGKEPVEEDSSIRYDVNGKSNVTIKFTPNEYLDIHSIEVNDKRLEASQYTLNEDGSISYAFTANAKSYDFLVQTKAQLVKLELDESSTAGYIIKDLPKDPVEVGKAIPLTLGVSDDSKWLEGKKITVTYNGVNLPVDESNFSFAITPIKGVSKIKVVVE